MGHRGRRRPFSCAQLSVGKDHETSAEIACASSQSSRQTAGSSSVAPLSFLSILSIRKDRKTFEPQPGSNAAYQNNGPTAIQAIRPFAARHAVTHESGLLNGHTGRGASYVCSPAVYRKSNRGLETETRKQSEWSASPPRCCAALTPPDDPYSSLHRRQLAAGLVAERRCHLSNPIGEVGHAAVGRGRSRRLCPRSYPDGFIGSESTYTLAVACASERTSSISGRSSRSLLDGSTAGHTSARIEPFREEGT